MSSYKKKPWDLRPFAKFDANDAQKLWLIAEHNRIAAKHAAKMAAKLEKKSK